MIFSHENKIKFISLVSTALLGLALPTWAGPRGGGGGFHGGGFAGGGRSGGGSHFGGGSRAAPAFYGGGFRGAPVPGVHTLPAEVLADQVPHLDSIMVVIACLPCDRRDSLAQSVDPRRPISPGPLQLLGNQTV